MTLKRLEDHYRMLRHEDPLSNEAGAFPVGTGVGAMLGGAAAGAAVGAVAGPVGALVGTIAGGVVGGYTGKVVSEYIDPTIEVSFARARESARPQEARPQGATTRSHNTSDDDPSSSGEWIYNPAFSQDDRKEDLEQRWQPSKRLSARNALGRHLVTNANYFDE